MSKMTFATLAMFQSGDVSVSAHDIHLLMFAVWIIAIALGVAACALFVMAGFAAKLLNSVDGIAKEVKDHTAPLLDKTHAMVVELAPKISHLTTNAEHISTTMRTKMDEIAVTVSQLNATVQETNLRTQRQVAHVDGIVSQALDSVEEISHAVQDGIRGPVRQVAGIIAGVRAGLEKLVERSPFGRG